MAVRKGRLLPIPKTYVNMKFPALVAPRSAISAAAELLFIVPVKKSLAQQTSFIAQFVVDC